MFIKFNIKGNIFDIICDLSIHLIDILDISKNYEFKYIFDDIKDLMLNNVILNLLLNEVKLNPSLNGTSYTNKFIPPTNERLIELNKYYNILNVNSINLYNMKQLFKKKIILNEFDINIIFLVKQIYNYINEINNLLSMLIIQPKGIYIISYGQLFNKFLNIKTHIATSIIYTNEIKL
jgi:hypothetical protein